MKLDSIRRDASLAMLGIPQAATKARLALFMPTG
jgi:hypothetical protein